MIQHFILTRCSYSDPELRERRWKLTERFLLPSLLGQTRDDFTWIKVGRSRDQCGWHVLAEHLHADTTHVLTTRVDDDDQIAADFVERLRSRVEETERPTVYVFPWGAVNDIQHGIHYDREYPANQFPSLLCPVSERLTVYCEQHDRLAKRFPVVAVDKRPAWTWVRHADQISRNRG